MSRLLSRIWPLALLAAVATACAVTFGQSCPPGSLSCPFPSPQSAPTRWAPLADPSVQPWRATVRIRVTLADGTGSTGTGTIILGNAARSIVLTCAHLFEIEGGAYPKRLPIKGRIAVDLFDGSISTAGSLTYCESFPGDCLGFDPGRDVGLVCFKPGRRLVSATLVPDGFRPGIGADLITVGCSNGKDATALRSRYLKAVRLSKSPDVAFECSGEPAHGRSGGGLHLASDGRLIGTCTGGDGGTGIYPSADSAWDLIRRVQLASLIEQGTEPEREPTAELEPIETNPSPNPTVKKPGLFHPNLGKQGHKPKDDAASKKAETAPSAVGSQTVTVQASPSGVRLDWFHGLLALAFGVVSIIAARVPILRSLLPPGAVTLGAAYATAPGSPSGRAVATSPPPTDGDPFRARVAELLAMSEANAKRVADEAKAKADAERLSEASKKIEAALSPT